MSNAIKRMRERMHQERIQRKREQEATLLAPTATGLGTGATVEVVLPASMESSSASKQSTMPVPVQTIPVVVDNALDKSEVDYDHLNSEQQTGVKLAVARHSYCLIGPAGSGKTTTVRSVAKALSDANVASTLDCKEDGGQWTKKFFNNPLEEYNGVPTGGMKSIAIMSFTNQAVRNIRECMPDEFKLNCTTIHNILEFIPVEFEDENDLDEYGTPKTKQVFAPTYGTLWNQAMGNILPHIDLVVIEEAGNVSLELFELFLSALPSPTETQFIFLGDLNQLPPPFNDGILGFKQLELPVVELTEVYRNVGIITKLAHRILEGKPILDNEAAKLSRTDPDSGDTITFIKFKKKYDAREATKQIGLWLKRSIISGKFTPEDTTVLIPFNVQFGTEALNKYIMQGINERDNLPVYEVTARGIKSYLCIGDRYIFNKNYHRITGIKLNPKYGGKPAIAPSVHLTRFGTAMNGKRTEVFGTEDTSNTDNLSTEDLLNATIESVESETVQATHVITLLNEEFGTEIDISAGNINSLLPLYCLTVHKSQGSEFDKVLLILHHTHSNMASREIFYTGVTRAKKEITVMYSGNYTNSYKEIGTSMMNKCLVRQKIAGDTATEKLEFFRKRARDYILSGGDGKVLKMLKSLKEEGKI